MLDSQDRSAVLRYLEAMEERIRADIRSNAIVAREEASAALRIAIEAKDKAIELAQQVMFLREKAGWIGAGFGATFLAALALAYHVFTGK